MIKTIKTTTETTIETELTDEDIINLIKSSKDYANCFEEDGKFNVTVRMPSGGDYSGMSLDIGQDVNIIVVQTSHKESEE